MYRFVLLLGLTVFVSVDAFKCHVCDSKNTTNCGLNFKEKDVGAIEAGKNQVCVKYVLNYNGNETFVKRFVSDPKIGIPNDIITENNLGVAADKINSEVKLYCSKDNGDKPCNGGNSLEIAFSTLIVAATAYLCTSRN